MYTAHIASNLDVCWTDLPDLSWNSPIFRLVFPRNCQQHGFSCRYRNDHIQLTAVHHHLSVIAKNVIFYLTLYHTLCGLTAEPVILWDRELKAKIHYNSFCFPVTSPQHKQQICSKSITSWRLPCSKVSQNPCSFPIVPCP